MKEKTLKDYLDNKVTVDILAADVTNSQKKASSDVISVYVDKINEIGEYKITRGHLTRLLADTIAGRLTTTDLNTISFALIGSEYFSWDETDNVLEDTIYGLDNPDIGFPLTIENLRRWKTYLDTGEYTFENKELKK